MIFICGLAILAAGCSTLNNTDSASLQGTWTGKEVGRETEGMCALHISGDVLEFRGADTNEWYKATFTLQEDKAPKQLTGAITECPAPEYRGKTVHAIYRIEAGTLTISGNEPGNPEVPARFDAPGTRQFVLNK